MPLSADNSSYTRKWVWVNYFTSEVSKIKLSEHDTHDADVATAIDTLAGLITGSIPTGGAVGQVLAKASGADRDTEWVDLTGGEGGTDLGWDASTRTITSNTGSDAVLPLADGSGDGLMSSADYTKLGGIEPSATADQTAAEIVALIDASATAEEDLATAVAGNATAVSTLGAAFSGDIDAGAFSAGAVALSDMADLAEARVLGRADGAGTGAPTALEASVLLTILGGVSGADGTLLTGTAGAANTASMWNVDGDLIEISAAGGDAIPFTAPDGAGNLAASVNTVAELVTAVDELELASITVATAVATTSGSAITFTGIPAGTTRLTLLFDGVSVSGTDNLLITLGDSGGLETTGYVSGSSQGTAATSSTAGMIVYTGVAARTVHGSMELAHIGANRWVASHVLHFSSGNSIIGGGSKTLSGELSQISLTVTSSDTFDAGQVTISYE